MLLRALLHNLQPTKEYTVEYCRVGSFLVLLRGFQLTLFQLTSFQGNQTIVSDPLLL
jgi:hypothetical protein